MKNSARAASVAAAVSLTFLTMAAAQEKPAGGPSEGIKVHGHWTIEIRNPDGSLVSHSEFENALVPIQGPELLAGVLANQLNVSSWELFLSDGSPDGRGPCSGGYGCLASGLGLELVGTEALQLKATFTATHDSVIRHVSTAGVEDGTSRFPHRFTQRDLAQGEERQVVAGQIIQVTVVFSFS
jgi:hypothetical protein